MSKRYELTSTNRYQPVLAGTRWDEKLIEKFSARLGHLTQQLHHHQAEVARLAAERRQTIADLRAFGFTQRQVAGILGISHARVEQLEAKGI